MWCQISRTITDFRARVGNDAHVKELDVITNPNPNFDGGLLNELRRRWGWWMGDWAIESHIMK